MDITATGGKIGLSFNKEAFVSPLIKMAAATVLTIEIGSVGNVEMAHEFAEISKRSFHQQMEMIGHHDIAMQDYVIGLNGFCQDLQKLIAVVIVLKNSLPLIAAIGDMIHCTGILDSKRARHSFSLTTDS